MEVTNCLSDVTAQDKLSRLARLSSAGAFQVFKLFHRESFLFTLDLLLRSSLVSRHGKPRGESWKAPAREREETDQARTVGIIGLERIGGGRQGTDLLAALGRARPLVFEERELSRYL